VSSDSPRIAALAALYQRYLDHQDSAALVASVSEIYTQGTLERLAEHPHCLVRRAAVLALGFLADYEANPVMGRALTDDDRTVRILAENGIRGVWARAGNAEESRLLESIVRLNAAQRYQEAVRRAGELIQKAPWFAEPWNQRALARFALGQYADCIRDCHQALEINPYHFAAAAGMGQAYLHLNDHVAALEAFRRALRLNPGLESIRVQVNRLARMIEGK